MTIEKWLSNLHYDKFSQTIWNKAGDDGDAQMVADIRGWGFIQYRFDTAGEAAKFQDEVGEFVAEAIREKIERLKNK